MDKYGLRNVHLYEEGEEWIALRTQGARCSSLRADLSRRDPIPKRFIGSTSSTCPR